MDARIRFYKQTELVDEQHLPITTHGHPLVPSKGHTVVLDEVLYIVDGVEWNVNDDTIIVSARARYNSPMTPQEEVDAFLNRSLSPEAKEILKNEFLEMFESDLIQLQKDGPTRHFTDSVLHVRRYSKTRTSENRCSNTTLDGAPCLLIKSHRSGENPTPCRSITEFQRSEEIQRLKNLGFGWDGETVVGKSGPLHKQ